MSTIFYEVAVTIPDPAIAARWVAWMNGGHIADVVAAGAKSGRIITLDDNPGQYLAQYEFESRESMQRYFSQHAPRLREEGLRLFAPPDVIYARRTGEILPP